MMIINPQSKLTLVGCTLSNFRVQCFCLHSIIDMRRSNFVYLLPNGSLVYGQFSVLVVVSQFIEQDILKDNGVDCV